MTKHDGNLDLTVEKHECGCVSLRCSRGCSPTQIATALGLTVNDLLCERHLQLLQKYLRGERGQLWADRSSSATYKAEYQRYLASREWAVLREKVRKRSGGLCERCSRRPMDAVHHLTYERVGHELLTDLQAICNPCHKYLSGKTNRDPVSNAGSTPRRSQAVPW